jgi:hypothetical protein
MLWLFLALAIGVFSYPASAQFGSEGRAMWPSAAMRWGIAPGAASPEMQQAVLLGDPSRSGRYTIRVRLPTGYSLLPHVYGETREVRCSLEFCGSLMETNISLKVSPICLLAAFS